MIFILSFKDFCNNLRNYTKGINSNSMFVVRMFKSIGNAHFLTCDDNDNYAAKLHNGSKPLSISTTSKSPIPFRLQDCYLFFVNHMNSDYLQNILRAFGASSNVELVNFKALCYSLAEQFKLFHESDGNDTDNKVLENYAKYIADPLVSNDIDLDNNDIGYLMEMNGECPLCEEHQKLYREYRGRKLANYKIARIYPDILPTTLEPTFNAIKRKPSNIDDLSNKIALCPTCFDNYFSFPDKDDYQKLVDAKRAAVEASKFEKLLDDETFEEHLSQVLEFIKDTDEDISSTELSLEAKTIENKIPNINKGTKKNISTTNVQFFAKIDDFLTDRFGKGRDDSTVLGKKIRAMSDNLLRSGYDGINLIDKLANDINNTLPSDIRDEYYVRAILYYFLQHCEVLSR